MNHFAKRLPLLLLLATLPAQTTANEAPQPVPAATQNRAPIRTTIGMPKEILELVLPGSELEALPATSASNVIVRIDDVRPHGTAHRYALTFTGLQAGSYDLRDFLQHKDHTPLSETPKIPIQIDSILPKEQTQPNALKSTAPTPLGGYATTMLVLACSWLLLLCVILFVGRKRKRNATLATQQQTLAERLLPLVLAAQQGQLQRERLAELEWLLLSVWRTRLGLEQRTAAEAIQVMREHKEAGALLRQLEQWLHAPSSSSSTDVEALLRPYAALPAPNEPGGPL